MGAAQNFEPPFYMEEGSKGKAVDLVLLFLFHWKKQQDSRKATGIVLNGNYTGRGLALMCEYQKAHRLDDDGGVGPKTRKQMCDDGFNFVARAKALGHGGGITAFAQPDGKILFWGPKIPPTPDEIAARADFEQAHAGK